MSYNNEIIKNNVNTIIKKKDKKDKTLTDRSKNNYDNLMNGINTILTIIKNYDNDNLDKSKIEIITSSNYIVSKYLISNSKLLELSKYDKNYYYRLLAVCNKWRLIHKSVNGDKNRSTSYGLTSYGLQFINMFKNNEFKIE